MKQKLFVANWKMNMPFDAAITFVTQHKKELTELIKNNNEKSIVLCPSFPALHPLNEIVKNTSILLGAQDCSEHEKGAYTGEVSATSLAQGGCTFCIVGHSERRTYMHETDDIIAQKVLRLLEKNIQPIICIGETKEEYEQKKTVTVLTKQLEPILKKIKTFYHTPTSFSEPWLKAEKPFPLCIAYEPVWSIGTGIIPDQAYIEQISTWITEKVEIELDFDTNLQVLYGGSVDPSNAKNILKISTIHGFLIGGASLDFQKLQKIVSLE